MQVNIVPTTLFISFAIFLLLQPAKLLDVDTVPSNKQTNALIISDSQPNGNDDDEVTLSVDVEQSSSEVFEAARDWKVIQPGQAIPRGLHVRLNLATGRREAKLLNEAQKDSNENTEDNPGNSGNVFSAQELKEALQHIKADDVAGLKFQDKKGSEFRSIEELKQEFKSLNLNVKSETDILKDLLSQYKACKAELGKIVVLQDIEYIVHQFDVAQDLVRLEGLELLLPGLNSSEAQVRGLIAASLGAAMQGNPKVQISVLEHNGLSLLMRLVILDNSASVRAKGMFALSCLLRHFPFAQQRFLQNGGIQLFTEILQENVAWEPDSLKIKLKVITLLYDLLVEYDFAVKHLSSDKANSNLKQYAKLSLPNLLVQHDFCNIFGQLLSVPDKEIQKYVILTMVSLSRVCVFKNQDLLLQNLVDDYSKMLNIDNFDEDVKLLLENVNLLLHKSHVKEEL